MGTNNNFKAIHHLSMLVADLAKSLHFYCDVLGLEQDLNRPDFSFDGAWLTINAEQQIHLLQLDNPDSKLRPEHGGRDRHAAFKVNRIDLIQSSLEEHHIPFTRSQSGRAALFCRDPDGNTLEIMK